MDEWIKKLKTDRTVTMEDGSDADKYMVITGLNGCIDRLIAHIEQLEAENLHNQRCWNETMTNTCRSYDAEIATYKSVMEYSIIELKDDHIQKNKFRMGALGSGMIDKVIEILQQALQAAKEGE